MRPDLLTKLKRATLGKTARAMPLSDDVVRQLTPLVSVHSLREQRAPPLEDITLRACEVLFEQDPQKALKECLKLIFHHLPHQGDQKVAMRAAGLILYASSTTSNLPHRYVMAALSSFIPKICLKFKSVDPSEQQSFGTLLATLITSCIVSTIASPHPSTKRKLLELVKICQGTLRGQSRATFYFHRYLIDELVFLQQSQSSNPVAAELLTLCLNATTKNPQQP